MILLGISGVKGSGKDSLADQFVEHHGFVKIAFADELKRILVRLFDFDPKVLWGPSELKDQVDPRNGLVPRISMQLIGTAVRKINPQAWIRTMAYNVAMIRIGFDYTQIDGISTPQIKPPKGIVISDCRYANEIDYVRGNRGYVVQMEPPTTEQRIRAEALARGLALHEDLVYVGSDSHSSETEQLSLDPSLFFQRILNPCDPKFPSVLQLKARMLLNDIAEHERALGL